jgi:opacity protein-like surface antigen
MGGEWMIGKFATASAVTLLVLRILWGTQVAAQDAPAGTPPAPPASAQQAPAPPAPAAQTPANGQEPADEGSLSRRKARPLDYKKWVYNVGAGANVDSGSTKTFVRGGGVSASAGVARNASKYLGLRADVVFANLPLRDSTLQFAQATGASSYALGVSLDPIINLPINPKFSAYVLFGPAFYHRWGSLDSDSTVPGSPCSPFWSWWGACSKPGLSLSGSFVNTSLNQFGYNFGGGVVHKMPSGVEIYAEYRFNHGSNSGVTTDFRPITVGFRW